MRITWDWGRDWGWDCACSCTTESNPNGSDPTGKVTGRGFQSPKVEDSAWRRRKSRRKKRGGNEVAARDRQHKEPRMGGDWAPAQTEAEGFTLKKVPPKWGLDPPQG